MTTTLLRVSFIVRRGDFELITVLIFAEDDEDLPVCMLECGSERIHGKQVEILAHRAKMLHTKTVDDECDEWYSPFSELSSESIAVLESLRRYGFTVSQSSTRFWKIWDTSVVSLCRQGEIAAALCERS